MINKNYLVINSNERINPNDEVGNAIYQLPHGFINRKTKNGQDYCKLIKMLIANTFYNVTNSNNTLIIDGNNIVIPNGNYNLDELFQYLVNNVAQITDIQYNDITCKSTITLSSSLSLSFPTTNSAHLLLGFNQNYNSTSATHISARTPAIYDLEIFVEIEGLSSQYISTNSKMSFMPTFVVSNNVNKNNFNAYYEKTHFSQISKVMNMPNQFYIRLKNQNNEILQCCSDYTIILSFIEVCC